MKITLLKPITPEDIFELNFKIKSPDAFNMKKIEEGRDLCLLRALIQPISNPNNQDHTLILSSDTVAGFRF